IIEEMPDLSSTDSFQPETHRWLGRAAAIVDNAGDIRDRVELTTAISSLRTTYRDPEAIRIVLYRCLAKAELRAPAGVRGSFIPVGNPFDTFAALEKVLSTGTEDVLIVDAYMDSKTLTEHAPSVPEKASVRLLAEQSKNKPSLIPAAANWVKQFGLK